MEKKNLVQIILIIILIFFSFFIFTFFYKSENNIEISKSIENTSKESNNAKNLIENIKYTSNNINGDIFEILAEFGEPSSTNPELMFLKNVTGNIILKNKSNIKLTSDYANFNTNSFETTFLNNVKIVREDEIILGKELYLVFDQKEELIKENPKIDQNLIRLSYDVIVKKPGYILQADVLEIDLITKNLKIYMIKENDKVQTKTEIN